MSVKQASIHVVRMRFVTITWDHTTALAVLGTLEMDKRVLVIVKFLLTGCYYIFFLGYVHNSFKILFTQRCKKNKTKQNKTKKRTNERTNERNNVPTPRQYQAGNHYQGMDSSRAKVFV